jgi:hypothetical protein
MDVRFKNEDLPLNLSMLVASYGVAYCQYLLLLVSYVVAYDCSKTDPKKKKKRSSA